MQNLKIKFYIDLLFSIVFNIAFGIMIKYGIDAVTSKNGHQIMMGVCMLIIGILGIYQGFINLMSFIKFIKLIRKGKQV